MPDTVPGHPELKPDIARITNRVLAMFTRLIITSTTDGVHAINSFHPLGRAVDLGTEPYNKRYQDDAAMWIARNLTLFLVEGIHNIGLSVKHGKNVPVTYWGEPTWSNHRNHIHLAA